MTAAPLRSLLHWNICHGGGGRRLPGILLELLERSPDLILLSEYRSGRGGQLRAVLDDHGWHHQRCTEPPRDRNGLLLASRVPFREDAARPPSPPPSMAQRWLEACLDDGSPGGTTVLGMHLPDEPRSTRRALAWRHLIARATALATERAVIAGDLNVGRAGLDETTPRFGNQPGLGALATLGYADAFRLLHGNRRAYSWAHPTGGSFRIDHTLVSHALRDRVRLAEYAETPWNAGLSDHCPMVVGLGPDAPGTCEPLEKQGSERA